MFNGKFTEQDKENFIDFVNFISKKAEFKMNTDEVIKYFKLLSIIQKEILPKIEANILEVKEVSKKQDK